MISLNCSLNGAAHRTRLLLALAVVREHVAGRHAVWGGAVLALAFHDVIPMGLHATTLFQDRALAGRIRAFRSVAQNNESLL